jgi:hypothetical protein
MGQQMADEQMDAASQMEAIQKNSAQNSNDPKK